MDFRLPGMLRQLKCVRVLPGLWPEEWKNYAGRVVGALDPPGAPKIPAEVV